MLKRRSRAHPESLKLAGQNVDHFEILINSAVGSKTWFSSKLIQTLPVFLQNFFSRICKIDYSHVHVYIWVRACASLHAFTHVRVYKLDSGTTINEYCGYNIIIVHSN